MKVVEIRSEAELQHLSAAWEALLRDSASNTIFLTREWLEPWWFAYANPGEMRLLAAFDDKDVLRGIAPLRSQTVRKYGQRIPVLSFIGDGSNDSDYLDFLIARGWEQSVMEAFHRHLAKEFGRGTVLLLNEMPEQSPNLPLLKSLMEPGNAIWTETDVPCGTVRLPAIWEEYLNILRPRFRTKVRAVLRNLESRTEVRFGFCEDTEQIRRLLPVLFDLHSRRWRQDGKSGVFGWDQKRRFYELLSPLLLERGWLRFTWMEWNGRVLACQYGFVYRDIYFHLQEGYEPESEHQNLGIALRAWSIRELLKQGVREYDFLGGIGRHKTDWGAEVKRSKRITIANPSLPNILFCRGPEWEGQARRSVKKILPERVLAAYRNWSSQRAAAAQTQNGHADSGPRRYWIRNVAAHAYFRLGFPAIIRPFRDRYQLSTPSYGKVPKISKRTAASGRILYYHRVNDDGDPFFPATPTALFQQEMRYLAQHYKVVSLPALLKHLRSDSPETVLAITFDDGYQDNFTNAFPVLRDYGLPATIFLTTGSMDSREPLWFEQLAYAVKRTERQFIDIEIDIPRRFWMRTQLERLDANDRIFALLRGLEDSERRSQLNDILDTLAVTGTERKNALLTWDQVRFMKRHGFDFGGHTVTHPFLSKLTPAQAAWEVSECKRRIEEELQAPADYFAYPNGREEDFSRDNEEAIRNAGYRAAVTTIWGMNFQSTHPMELRRGGPWEESAAQFAYKLDWYQLVND